MLSVRDLSENVLAGLVFRLDKEECGGSVALYDSRSSAAITLL